MPLPHLRCDLLVCCTAGGSTGGSQAGSSFFAGADQETAANAAAAVGMTQVQSLCDMCYGPGAAASTRGGRFDYLFSLLLLPPGDGVTVDITLCYPSHACGVTGSAMLHCAHGLWWVACFVHLLCRCMCIKINQWFVFVLESEAVTAQLQSCCGEHMIVDGVISSIGCTFYFFSCA